MMPVPDATVLSPDHSGNGAFAGMGVPLASYTSEQIVTMVDTHERDVTLLRDRMEADYRLYRLEPFVPVDPVTGEELKEYAAYTTNEPRNYANKVIGWLTQAKLLLRVPHSNDHTHLAETDNLKEHFAVGLLRAADERLIRLVQPKLRGQLAFFATVRGGVLSGRCLLRKVSAGGTSVDIVPWDPINTHWATDDEGLKWACYKIKKTAQQIRNDYGVALEGEIAEGDTSADAETQGVEIYDFYDREINTVIAGRQVIKPPTPHGAPRVPVFMVLVGPTPLLQSPGIQGAIADIGESVYESVRNLYKTFNDIMSIVVELVGRSRDPGTAVTSADGKKTLPENPFKRGSTISLRPEEKVEALKLLEMAKDTATFLALIQGEIQRGTLPHTVYGELAFQLSGYAINTLRQGIESVLLSRLDAMEQAYLQMANLVYDQYQTGQFDTMQLSGIGADRKYFSHQIAPEVLRQGCDYTVELVSQLPQDDMTRYNIAQIAKDLFARPWIKDNILGIQDSEQTEQQFFLQKAQEILPEAGLYTLMKAAEDQGNATLAGFYFGELVRIIMAKTGMMPPGPVPGASPNGGTPEGPPGNRPEAMPFAATGAPPAPETSNAGTANVPPATPRPGARQTT